MDPAAKSTEATPKKAVVDAASPVSTQAHSAKDETKTTEADKTTETTEAATKTETETKAATDAATKEAAAVAADAAATAAKKAATAADSLTSTDALATLPAGAVSYGPKSCIFTYLKKDTAPKGDGEAGVCIVRTNCGGKVDPVTFQDYSMGVIAVDKAGTPVRHLFGK